MTSTPGSLAAASPAGIEEKRSLWDGSGDRMAAAALLLLVLVTFWTALPADRVLFERDIGSYWCPQVESLVRAVAEGAWPVWNPRFGFGGPMWSDPGYQVAYPFTWLNAVFGPWTYYKLFVIAHCFLAMLGFYAFARTIRLHVFASFAGAVAWGLSGPFLSAANLNHHFASAAWIPAVLFAWARALRSGGGVPLLAAVVALQLLAGSADVVATTVMLALAYAATSFGEGRGAVRAHLWRATRVGIAALLLAAALSAVQWLPTASLLAAGSRLNLKAADNLVWSVHPLSLVDLVVPRLVEDLPLTEQAAQRLGQPKGSFLATLHLGLPVLALGLLALRHPARGLRFFALGSFVFFLLLALGSHTPLLPALLAFKPLALFRYPSKYLFAVALASSVLAALGVDAWLRGGGRRDRALAALAASGLALLAAAFSAIARDGGRLARAVADLIPPGEVPATLPLLRLRLSDVAWVCFAMAILLVLRAARVSWSAPTAVAAVALMTISLVGIGRTTYLVAPRAAVQIRPGVAAAVAQAGGRRVSSERYPDSWLNRRLRPALLDPFVWAFMGSQELMAAPTASRWRIDGSFDRDLTGLGDRQLALLARTFNDLRDPELRTRLLQVGAVDHVVALVEPAAVGLQEVAAVASPYTLPIRLYAVPNPLPRSYVVGRGRPVGDEAALRQLLSPDFDFRREVLLPEGSAAVESASRFEGTSVELERRADRVALDVRASAPALVVLVESFDSGWHASVDGVDAAVERANTAFRAVRVPPGRHRVELCYRPASVFLGLAVSIVSALGCLAWAWGSRRSSRRGLGDWAPPR